MFDIPLNGWIGTPKFLDTADEIVRRMADVAHVEDIAAEAVRRHNVLRPRPGLPTCHEWCPGCGEPIDTEWVVRAVRLPRPCSRDEWLAWSGDHRGNWYNAKDQFVDHAIWCAPVEMKSDAEISAIVQPVQCYAEEPGRRVAQRRGWNATLADRPHVLG
jgi:hypothetical protein